MTPRAAVRTLALLCWMAAPVAAQDSVPASVVAVFAGGTATLPLAGVTRVMSLDETICRVEIADGAIRFQGLLAGDTVVFAWTGDVRMSLLVHVTQKADPPRRATLSAPAREALGQGRVGMSVMRHGAAASARFITHEYWDWQQTRNGARLAVRGFTNTYADTAHPFNLASLSIEHTTANRKLSLADFTLQMSAAGEQPGSSSYGAYTVRGVDYAITSGRNRIEVFAGNTVPAYFLDVAGTRGIAGAKIDHTLNPAFKLFSTVGIVRAPVSDAPSAPQEILPFQTAGLVYAPTQTFSARANAGVSRHGVLGDVQVDYARGPFTASAGVTDTRGEFALNRLQLLTAGDASVRALAGWTWARVSLASAARRTVSKPGGIGGFAGTSDSLSQHIQLNLPYHQQLSAGVTRNTSTGSVLGSHTNTRLDGSWSTPLGSHLNNSLQGSVGWNAESTQLHSYNEITIRDALTLSFPSGSLFATFEHQRLDPSLLARVRQVIDSLPAEMRDLFSLNPELFLDTVELPPDVQRLLETARPSSTSMSVGGQITRGRLSLGPNLSIIADATGTEATRLSYMLGYSATWQLSPTWQLRSTMTNRLFYDGSAAGFRRSNVATIGIDKSFQGLPRWLAPMKATTIDGRVFRDNAVDGVPQAGDPGLAGVRVRLDDSRTATTDAEGRFRFNRVTPGMRLVSVDLTQFPEVVRVTTPSRVAVEAITGTTEVNFGLVNFARVIGNVFSDYNNDARRQSDAPGLPRIRVRISDGTFSTEVVSDSSGDYEAVNIPPGEYEVAIVADDLPADYVVPVEPVRVRVAPTATMVADLPVRALRSISGRVVLRTTEDAAPTPVVGVTIRAGSATATTDADGKYALRGLPAGLVEVRIAPARDMPAQLQAPRGVVRLTTEPMHLENANIVIKNAGLLEYLAPAGRASRR